MLRPSSSLLYSSRAARRAHTRAETRKAAFGAARTLSGVLRELVGFGVDLAMLLGLPILYLMAAWFVVDVPARWAFGGQSVTPLSVAELVAGSLISLIALARMLQQAPPIQPVSPQFARRALLAGWVAAILLTVGDIAG